MSTFIDELDEVVDREWQTIKMGNFFSAQTKSVSKNVYIETMIQIYHYTKHNAINQASAAFATDHEKLGLMHFALKHASEELGHERMILRDLSCLGVDEVYVKSANPLAPTEALNGYLYSVAIRGGVIPRLGYSYWAEDSYGHIRPVLDQARKSLGLSDDQMTFFVAHSSIDAKHSQEVRSIIEKWVLTEEDRAAVKQVAKTTLYLTGQILEASLEACHPASNVRTFSFK